MGERPEYSVGIGYHRDYGACVTLDRSCGPGQTPMGAAEAYNLGLAMVQAANTAHVLNRLKRWLEAETPWSAADIDTAIMELIRNDARKTDPDDADDPDAPPAPQAAD